MNGDNRDGGSYYYASDENQAPRPYSPPPYGPYEPTRTNSLAVVSFVLAFFASILSIIFGHIALSQIRKTGEKGRGLALAGLWISYLSIVAAIVTLSIILGLAAMAANSHKDT